jgi:hypothetical protein
MVKRVLKAQGYEPGPMNGQDGSANGASVTEIPGLQQYSGNRHS